MAPEGPDRHEEQDHEADEDVRAVQAGQAVEDRPERSVVRCKAEARVLARLRQQEDKAHQKRQHQTGSKAGCGHGSPLTTRTKKYAVKNEPNSMISDAMKSSIPSTDELIREL